jgi:WD40 repeat protein
LQSARWSPDGACLLTNSDDNVLRVYDVPEDALVRRAARLTGAFRRG